jgi:long-chain acyl-CoA synthetase
MIVPASRGRNPFDMSGIERGPDHVARYRDRPRSLVELLRASVDRGPRATAVSEVGGQEISYGELWDRAAIAAGGLRDRGVGRGDRVALRMPNCLEWVVAFWGVQLAGAVAVPINTRLTEAEAAFIVSDAGASLTIEAGEQLPAGPPLACEDLAPDDVAAVFYTSGTTGRPKGAMTSHANFASNSENVIRSEGLDRAEGPTLSTLVSVPLFHVTGCNSQLIPFLELGGRVEILRSALDIEGLLGAVSAHRITHLVTVPAIYHAIMRHERLSQFDVSSVRWALYGGAPIVESLVRRIQDCFPNARLGNGFGLTESSSLVSLLPHEETERHRDSVGFAMPVVDLALRDPDPGSGVGELLVRGPNVVRGYWNDARATASTITDGWLHTGDLARLSPDGLLYIADRLKDMINRGGENVYCIEVENALSDVPGIDEVAAVGVPDSMMGEKVGAVLVPLPGHRIVVEDVIARVRGVLADFKVPQYVAVRHEPLPRNASGKILKARLRDETDWGSPLR